MKDQSGNHSIMGLANIDLFRTYFCVIIFIFIFMETFIIYFVVVK